MKKIFSFISLLIIITQQIFAVTAYPYPIEYALPDGTTLTITLKGDENIHWAMSEDGYTLLANQDGFYEYAVLDANGNLVSSGVKARNISVRSYEDFVFLNNVQKDLRYSEEQVYYRMQILEWRNTMSKYLAEKEDSPLRAATGVVRFPMILVGFQGKPFTLQKSQFEALLNQPSYTFGGIPGSVYDYFYASSYGQFEFQVDIFGPYTLGNAISYYDDECTGGDPRKMAREAAMAANADGCNFALYDYNNDGFVDGLHIIFAGYGQEAGAPACSAIWSHSWSINTTLTLNGKRVQKYSCSPEFRGTSGTNITYIGVIVHELNHVLGLPDTYDTDYASSGGQSVDLGAWCIMAGGSWNDNGRTPPYPSAWCRADLGWATTQVLSTPANVTIPNPQLQGVSYRINTNTNNEFFLLENRQKISWDAYIPSSGLLIYHVDRASLTQWNNNCVNCNPSHRYYYVKQAGCTNASSNCSSNRDRDPYPYGTNNSFTDTSVPNSKSWAGSNTAKPVTEITHNTTNRTISFKFMGGYVASSNANLASLTVNPGTLSPAFSANTTNYTVNVANSVMAITITGVAEHSLATVTGNVTNAALNVGNNNFTITVKAEDNTTKNYIVTVNRAANSNANLASLTVSSGTLTPAFSANTTNYTVNVANAVTAISITGTAEHSMATVTGNVTNAALNVGNNNFTITVKAEDNTTKNYVVTVNRAANSNANLASLTVSSGTLTPAFSPNTTAYTVNVANTVTAISITGTAEHSMATVTGNVTNAALNVGNNNFTITVKAEDNTTKSYVVTVNRAANSNANLASLTVNPGTLSPTFSANTTNYTVNVANSVTAITITGTAEHPLATVTGNVTNAALNVGNNIFTITVKAEDNTTKSYVVTVNRSANSNANLASLTVNPGTLSPTFSANTTNYTVNVANSVTAITITGAAEHPLATVTGNVTNAALNVGNNNFTITVKAEDNTTKSYVVTVNRSANSNANLASLTVNPGTLTPVFSANTTNYTVNVANSVTAITITGVAEHSLATVTGNVTNAALNVGNNNFTITVTAEDNTTKSYIVTVNRAANSNANLASLTVNPGTLTPVFSANTTNYTVNVANSVTAITITGVAEHSLATVTGNVTNAALNVGNNNFTITVKAEDNTTKSYIVTVNRAANSNANLASLTVNQGTLTPVFSANTTNYTVNVANSVTAISITGTAEHPLATVTGNVTNAALNVGNNNFTITVTAEDNTTKSYIVTVNRAANSNANLASLTVNPGTLTPAFSANTTNYTVNVANAVTAISITGTAEHPLATVTGNVTNAALNVGNNNFTITVTAEDNTTKSYIVTVNRAANSNANLANLTVNPGTLVPDFLPEITNYTVNVANAVTAISITGTAEHPLATVTGNVTNAALNVGNNNFTITVTAEDNTTKSYVVTVIRAASSNANLASLTVNPGTLVPDFLPEITDYIVDVDYSIIEISIFGEAEDENATVAGNIDNAPLSVGNNDFTITVTAEDNTIKNYYITVIRADIVINQFTIIASVEGNIGGTITPEGEIIINEGESITFDMFPDDNYIIDSVFVDGLYVGKLNTYTFDSVASNHFIVVTFVFINSIEIFETRKVEIYPNPANNHVVIKSDDFINNILVFSSDGKKVLEVKNINDKSYNLIINNLASGIYYLRVDDEVKKLIKEK